MSLPLNQILLGDCCDVLGAVPDASVEFVLTDPPYLVAYRDRSGRSLAGDVDAGWLRPAFNQMHRVLKPDSLCVSFYRCAAARRVIAHLAGSRVSSAVWGAVLCARWLGVVELLVGSPPSDA